MGLFGGRSKDERRLAETGTRVPAELVDADRAFFSGGNSSQRNSPRSSKQRWVAHLPEGGTLEFGVRSRWCPTIGIVVEAAVNEDRTEAVLILDQDDYNVYDDQERIKRDFRASELAAEQLRAGRSPEEARAVVEARQAAREAAAPPSLRDLKRR